MAPDYTMDGRPVRAAARAPACYGVSMRVELGAEHPGCWVDHLAGFLPPPEARRALATLRDELAWEQREIVLFGRPVLQPRLIAWAGALPYRYSGQTLPPRPFTATTQALLDRVSAEAGVPFNHLLANRYRDGNDSMGLHADAEPELGPDPVVATLSLGATRRLQVVLRDRRPGTTRQFPLADGDLFIMGGRTQRHFRHGIPRQPTVTGERISLTFRRVLRPP
jgi:alkylated DNA repair dioxygenase AlkB